MRLLLDRVTYYMFTRLLYKSLHYGRKLWARLRLPHYFSNLTKVT